ncbi:MAG TPA: autorepressor SdpR family transcription factor, partial [Nitrolancea sp.]|nr:autorepressor SdpR family transcription factor [Nitrolancea sp.]
RPVSHTGLRYTYFGGCRNNARALVMDAVFRALSDPTRREILRLLRAGDLSAGELSDRFPTARSTISGHLSVLKDAGLVVTERQGTTIIYSLNVAVYEELLSSILSLLGVGASGSGRRIEDGNA